MRHRGPVNSFFIRRVPGPNRFTRQDLSNFFLNSYIKLTLINYGIIIKSISTIICTVWHVDKYKVTFKLVINSRRISRGPAVEKHSYRKLLQTFAKILEDLTKREKESDCREKANQS